MKSKSIFLMVVSLGFGLVAAVGITQVMGRKSDEPTKQVETRSVLVAKDDLDINTKLTPEMFVEDQWPAELVLDDFATSFDEIENRVVRSRVRKRGPIYLSDLVHVTEANVLAIPAGFKVVGIKLAADDHINGLLQPGDFVDVIGVFRGNRSSSTPTSRTFLKKIQVFKVADSMTRQYTRDDASAKGSTVVGLLVNEAQSEQIVLVQRVAEIKLAIRGPEEDSDSGISAGATLDGFFPQAVPAVTSTTPGDSSMTFQPTFPGTNNTSPAPADEDLFEMWVHDESGSTKYVIGSDGHVSQVINNFSPPAPQVTPTPGPSPTDDSNSSDDDDEDFNDDGFDIDSDPLSDQFDSELED